MAHCRRIILVLCQVDGAHSAPAQHTQKSIGADKEAAVLAGEQVGRLPFGQVPPLDKRGRSRRCGSSRSTPASSNSPSNGSSRCSSIRRLSCTLRRKHARREFRVHRPNSLRIS